MVSLLLFWESHMKHTKRLIYGLLTVAAALGGLSTAQAQADVPRRELSIGEALQLGQINIPQLVRARTEQKVVESKKEGAALWLSQNPYATVLLGSRKETTSDPVAAGVQYQVHIEQALEIAGQRWTRLAAVASQVEVAKAQTELAQVESRALLLSAYVQASFAEQRVAVARGREETADRLLGSARTRLELGATGELEVNLAQIELGRVRGERVQAEVLMSSRQTGLGILCGLPASTPLLLSTSHALPPVLEVAPLDDLYLLAETERADLQAIRRQEVALKSEEARLRREAVPSLILAFDYQRDLPGQTFLGGTVGLTLPMWNRNQGPLAQVHATEQQRQAEERLLRTRIRGEVALASRKLQLLRVQVQEFQQNVLPPAERNMELLRRGWQAGKFDLFRVITASRELTETRLRLLDLLEDLWVAAIELERAVGAPLLQGVPS
jgi:cobalt-zinc-cadmium efflux system outer membrane protein